jgi:hypothetical protein
MSSWNAVEHEATDLADLARRRIEAHGLALVATIRADGSPRVSGVEPLFAGGELWFGMMPGSRKGADLARDPRFALHNATVDKDVVEGDVKVAGRAMAVEDAATKGAFLAAFEAATGYAPPPGAFDLFRAEVTEVVTIRPAEDHLVIESWHEGRGRQRVERR